jgi:hypothetical protein
VEDSTWSRSEKTIQHVFAKQLGNKGLLRYLVKQHAEIRDTIIEHMLCVLIGQKRPMRIY